MVFKTKEDMFSKYIKDSDVVLDIGFCGQGVQSGDKRWPHGLLKKKAKEVYGVDLEISKELLHNPRYQKASAENFLFETKFDVIFAGDLIEHLSNPGLFLDRCKSHLKSDGILILTTPNTFNLFNLAEKLTKEEPTVNSDHTFYFNSKTLSKLLEKNSFRVDTIDYIYTLDYTYKESWKKKFLNSIYWLLSKFTDKFTETLVIVAR